MWRRKNTGIIAVVLGVVLFIAGLVGHAFAAPKAALCRLRIRTVALRARLVTGAASRYPGTYHTSCW